MITTWWWKSELKFWLTYSNRCEFEQCPGPSWWSVSLSCSSAMLAAFPNMGQPKLFLKSNQTHLYILFLTNSLIFFSFLLLCLLFHSRLRQAFNKISGIRNKTYLGLISMLQALQGFRRCIAWNPSNVVHGRAIALPILANLESLNHSDQQWVGFVDGT